MSSRVLVAVRVAASPEHAFEVFTRDIALWWRPNPLFATTPRAPGRLDFETGPDGRLTETLEDGRVHELGRVREWSPPRDGGPGRLAFGWRPATLTPEQASEVVVSFEPVASTLGAAETRVTVEHIGWDNAPIDGAARHGFPLPVFLKHVGDWWRANLASFRVKL